MSVVERMLGMRPRPPRAGLVRRAVAGRIVVITGASRGIGAETARQLGRAGAHVVLMARTEPALQAVAEEIRGRAGTAHVVPVDLRDTAAVETAAAEVLRRYGPPAVVISNAGLSVHRTLDAYADRGHDIDRTIATNYVGPTALMRVLVPAMRGGNVVIVSSVSAVVPAPGWSAYGASKAATDAWAAAIAAEVEPEVGVAIVRLPLVRTQMSAPTEAYRTAPAMRPVDAAAQVIRAVVTGRRVIGPWWLTPLAVVLAICPRALDRLLRAHERRLNS